MTKNAGNHLQLFAKEALVADLIYVFGLIFSLKRSAKSGLLIFGSHPFISFFVVESYGLLRHVPEITAIFSDEDMDLVRSSRHRVKLLDNRIRSIDEVANALNEIRAAHSEYFLSPHRDSRLGWLKRALQPDLAVFFYDGHLISSTHLSTYNLGKITVEEMIAIQQQTWVSVGNYIGKLVGHFPLDEEIPKSSQRSPPGIVSTKDFKSDQFYTRGFLNDVPLHAASLVAILAQVNYVHFVFRDLAFPDPLTFFKFKFVTVYHAFSSLKAINASRYPLATALSPASASFFTRVFDIPGSRWLRNLSPLRNYLVHYKPELSTEEKLRPSATHVEVIESLAGDRKFEDIDHLLDQQLQQLSQLLEEGLNLSR